MFNKNKKVLCVMQVAEDYTSADSSVETVMPHAEDGASASEASVG
jgi:hypothetical protein